MDSLYSITGINTSEFFVYVCVCAQKNPSSTEKRVRDELYGLTVFRFYEFLERVDGADDLFGIRAESDAEIARHAERIARYENQPVGERLFAERRRVVLQRFGEQVERAARTHDVKAQVRQRVVEDVHVRFVHGKIAGQIAAVRRRKLNDGRRAKTILPTEGKVLISVSDLDKPEVVELAQGYYDAGFTIVATGNTYNLIKESGIPVEKIKKIHEGRPNISDALTNGELAMIINTPHGKQSAHDDSYIRKAAIKMRIPYMTNIAAAKASLEGIMEMKIHGSHEVKSLQEYHLAIK